MGTVTGKDMRKTLHVRTNEQVTSEFGAGALQEFVESGVLIPLGVRWCGTAETPGSTRLALSSETRETCMSALEHYGVWVPPYSGIHVTALHRQRLPRLRPMAVGEGTLDAGSEGSRDPDLVLHRRVEVWPDDDPLVPLRLALVHATQCASALDALIVFESAVERKLMTLREAEELRTTLPIKVKRAMGPVRSTAGSGSETKVRRFLEKERVQVVAQWKVEGVGRTDLLVGERLIIECDSRTHHTDKSAYDRDRMRDQKLASLGYERIRLTWEQVFLRWEETKAFLRGLIAAGVHRIARQDRLGRGAQHWREVKRREAERKRAERAREREQRRRASDARTAGQDVRQNGG
jgi:very-short-patch-repair endonuclease